MKTTASALGGWGAPIGGRQAGQQPGSETADARPPRGPLARGGSVVGDAGLRHRGGALDPLPDGRDQDEEDHEDTQAHEDPVEQLNPLAAGARVEVQQRGVDQGQRDAAQGAADGHEVVEVGAALDGDGQEQEVEADAHGGALRDLVLDAAHDVDDVGAGQELDGVPADDGDGVRDEEDDGEDGVGGVVGDVDKDVRVRVGAEHEVAQAAEAEHEDEEDEADGAHDVGEVLGVLHGGGDGEHDADPLEREDGDAAEDGGALAYHPLGVLRGGGGATAEGAGGKGVVAGPWGCVRMVCSVALGC